MTLALTAFFPLPANPLLENATTLITAPPIVSRAICLYIFFVSLIGIDIIFPQMDFKSDVILGIKSLLF